MDRYKTVINKKNIIILLSILFVCLGMFLFRQVEDTGFIGLLDNRRVLEKYIDTYSGLDFAAAYNEVSEARKSNYSDKILRAVCEKLEYLSGYGEYVDNVISNAETMSRRRLFVAQGGYRLKNIIKTMQDYAGIREVRLIFDNDMGFEAFLEYRALYYFIAMAMLAVVMMLLDFNSPQSRNITYYCPDGRGRLGMSHVIQLFGTELFVSAFIYFAVLLEAFSLYGFCDLNVSVQSTEMFRNYTFEISRMEYILINYAQFFAIVFMLSLLVWVFLNGCKAASLGIIGLCVLVGAEVLLYVNIEQNSRWQLLKKINLVNLLYVPGINVGYSNANIFGKPLNFMGVVITCTIALIVVLSIVSVLMAEYQKPVEEYPSGIKGWFAEKLHASASKSTVFIKEMYKLLITRKALVISIFFYITAICFINDNKVYIGENQINYDEMFLEIGQQGITGLRAEYEELEAEIRQTVADMAAADAKLAAGELTEDEYMHIYVKYIEVENKKNISFMLLNKLNYLEEVEAAYGIQTVVMPENGYNNAIGRESIKRELITGVLFMAAIWVMVADYFSYEKGLNSRELFYMMKRGGSWLYARKMLVCIALLAVLFMLVYGYDAVKMAKWYNMPFMDSSAMNLSFMRDSGYTGSIKGYIVALLTLRLAAGLTVCTCAATFSIKLGQKAQLGVVPAAGVAVMVVLLAFVRLWFEVMLIGFVFVTVIMTVIGGRLWNRRWE